MYYGLGNLVQSPRDEHQFMARSRKKIPRRRDEWLGGGG